MLFETTIKKNPILKKMLFDFPYSGIKSGFTFALQFFMLISDGLDGVIRKYSGPEYQDFSQPL